MPEVREVHTAPMTEQDARDAFERFMKAHKAEGEVLRGEYVTNLNGQRLTLVFTWDDMG